MFAVYAYEIIEHLFIDNFACFRTNGRAGSSSHEGSQNPPYNRARRYS